MKKLLRRALHDALCFLLRLRSQPYLPDPASRCVILAPHQDDEALGCAGLIHAHRSAGLPVEIIYLTDGSGSHPSHPRLLPADIALLRRAEAIHAMGLLGVSPSALHFLDAPDGTLARLSPADGELIAQRLATLLASLRPTDFFLPCRDDGSSEHVAAFPLARRALRLADLAPRLREYPVWSRWSPRLLARLAFRRGRIWLLAFPSAAAHKRAALAAYASQAAPTPPWPRPVLPAGFVALFHSPTEFFFES